MGDIDRGEEYQSSTPETDARSIYIGNVHSDVTPQEIAQFFEGCGAIVRVTIAATKQNVPKGYAYLEFEQKESVDEALKMAGKELHGQPVKVWLCY